MKRKKGAIGPKFLRFQDVRPSVNPSKELLGNIYEAVEGCLSIDIKDVKLTDKTKVLEIVV